MILLLSKMTIKVIWQATFYWKKILFDKIHIFFLQVLDRPIRIMISIIVNSRDKILFSELFNSKNGAFNQKSKFSRSKVLINQHKAYLKIVIKRIDRNSWKYNRKTLKEKLPCTFLDPYRKLTRLLFNPIWARIKLFFVFFMSDIAVLIQIKKIWKKTTTFLIK